eukprot:550985-Pleurochrysis_carterae.AAC.1
MPERWLRAPSRSRRHHRAASPSASARRSQSSGPVTRDRHEAAAHTNVSRCVASVKQGAAVFSMQ